MPSTTSAEFGCTLCGAGGGPLGACWAMAKAANRRMDTRRGIRFMAFLWTPKFYQKKGGVCMPRGRERKNDVSRSRRHHQARRAERSRAQWRKPWVISATHPSPERATFIGGPLGAPGHGQKSFLYSTNMCRPFGARVI